MRHKKNKVDLFLEICIFITTLIVLLILIIQVIKTTPRIISTRLVLKENDYSLIYKVNKTMNNLNINDLNKKLFGYNNLNFFKKDVDDKIEANHNMCFPEEEISIIKITEKSAKKIKTFNYNPCPKPKKEYPDMELFNLGQDISLPDKTYIPKDLTMLEKNLSTTKILCLTKETKKSFDMMIKNAKKDGIIIKASSAFRGFNTQNILFSSALMTNPKALISLAKPGHSEHQLGTTVDLTGPSIRYASASDDFENTPEDLWLRENAYLYGFVQSYPKEKENATGYRYEPWHYRYIGIENAKEIKEKGITVSEFLK